jgi:hypothetical protein
MSNYYIQSITDKSPNQYIFNLTGSPSLNSIPLSLTGINTEDGTPIRFLRLTSPAPLTESTPRSSLINSEFYIDLNQPADVFYVFRYLPTPTNTYTNSAGRYSIFTFLLSGYGPFGTGLSEFVHYYYFNANSGSLRHGFLSDVPGTSNNDAIRFEANEANPLLLNSFQTGKFVVFNWTYDGSKNFGDGGRNGQTLMFNNQTLNLVTIANQSTFEMATGIFSRNTQFGYTGTTLAPGGSSAVSTVPNCLLGEILYYNRVLLPNERGFVFNYLSGKWGV